MYNITKQTAREYIYNDKENVITYVNLNELKLLQFYDKCGRYS